MTTDLARDRERAWQLFCESTESESLRKHALAVEAAMRAYARRFGEDEERGPGGLLHDLDYERYPRDATGHPVRAVDTSAPRLPGIRTRAMLSHAPRTTFRGNPDGEYALRGG